MTKILVLEKPEEKLRRERERLLGELSVYGERLAFLQDTVDEIKEMIEYYDGAIENLGIDHAEQNSKTIKEAFGGVKTKIAGQYLEDVYRHHDDLLKRLRSEGYDYLARDKDSILCAYDGSPSKAEDEGYWDDYRTFNHEHIFNDNFPEVQWTDEKATKISDLLATYENGGENGK